MKVNGAKIGIFLGGFGLGAAVSYFVTNKIVEKAYKDAADEEITSMSHKYNEKIKGFKDQIKELQDKITRQKVTINTLADQVRENKQGDVSDILKELDDDDEEGDPGQALERSQERARESEKEARRVYREYRKAVRRPRREDRDEDEVDYEFDPVEEEEAIKESKPRVIDEGTFSNTAMDYSKEELSYYIYDGKMISEDGEYLDNYAGIIGEDWLSYGKRAGDEVYVRNDNLMADYMITFVAGFGEQHITDSSNEWED